MTNDKLLEMYKELSEGFHKAGLAIHGVTVRQEAHEARLSTCEEDLNKGENSIQTRLARFDVRLKELEKDARNQTGKCSDHTSATASNTNELARLREQFETFRQSVDAGNELDIARENNSAQIQVTRLSSRATVIAAWIGASVGLLATIAALILAFTK